MGRKVINVVGASAGAGATFVASRLSLYMGRSGSNVTFLECHNCTCSRCERSPLVYYELELYKLMRFTDFFFEKATGRRTDNRINYYKGVNWVVKTPASPPCIILPEDVAGQYVVWDNSEDLDKADLILCVVCLEAKHLMAGADLVRFCRDNYPGKTLYIFNGVTSEAAVKSAEKLFKIEADFCIKSDKKMQEETLEELGEYVLTLF